MLWIPPLFPTQMAFLDQDVLCLRRKPSLCFSQFVNRISDASVDTTPLFSFSFKSHKMFWAAFRRWTPVCTLSLVGFGFAENPAALSERMALTFSISSANVMDASRMASEPTTAMLCSVTTGLSSELVCLVSSRYWDRFIWYVTSACCCGNVRASSLVRTRAGKEIALQILIAGRIKLGTRRNDGHE